MSLCECTLILTYHSRCVDTTHRISKWERCSNNTRDDREIQPSTSNLQNK